MHIWVHFCCDLCWRRRKKGCFPDFFTLLRFSFTGQWSVKTWKMPPRHALEITFRLYVCTTYCFVCVHAVAVKLSLYEITVSVWFECNSITKWRQSFCLKVHSQFTWQQLSYDIIVRINATSSKLQNEEWISFIVAFKGIQLYFSKYLLFA